ncbi:hypothetical protein Avbf_11371, partial [Armadillidium vulgare]
MSYEYLKQSFLKFNAVVQVHQMMPLIYTLQKISDLPWLFIFTFCILYFMPTNLSDINIKVLKRYNFLMTKIRCLGEEISRTKQLVQQIVNKRTRVIEAFVHCSFKGSPNPEYYLLFETNSKKIEKNMLKFKLMRFSFK